MKTPEESVAERTWTIRPTIEDEELRQLLATVMKITGQSRQDALLEIIRAELPGVVKRVAAEKRKLLNEIMGSHCPLSRLFDSQGLLCVPETPEFRGSPNLH